MKSVLRTITSPQILAMVIAGVFLFTAIFSLPFWMQPDAHGMMPGCPFMLTQRSVCQMSVVEHIAKWQQLFTAVFSESNTLAFLAVLLLTIVLFATFTRGSKRAFSARALSPPVLKTESEATLFNHLVVAFSEGILHPKIY